MNEIAPAAKNASPRLVAAGTPAESRWERARRVGDSPAFRGISQLRGVMENPLYRLIVTDPRFRFDSALARFVLVALAPVLPLISIQADAFGDELFHAILIAAFFWWLGAAFLLIGSSDKGTLGRFHKSAMRDLVLTPYTSDDLARVLWGHDAWARLRHLRAWGPGALWLTACAALAALVGATLNQWEALGSASLMGGFLASHFAVRSNQAEVALTDTLRNYFETDAWSLKVVAKLPIWMGTVFILYEFLPLALCYGWAYFVSTLPLEGSPIPFIVSVGLGPILGAGVGRWRVRSGVRNLERNYAEAVGRAERWFENFSVAERLR